jgi:glycosyltransferase involved in cell wall biosynthesis
MKVLFDSQIFNAQQYGGISRYYANLAKQLHDIDGVTTSILAPTYINNYLPQISGNDRVFGFKAKVKWQSLSRVFSHMACHVAIPIVRPDIIHKTYYYPERYPLRAGRSILTVYDMIHELYPENFSASDKTSKYKFEAVMKADHIICISENTRSDLLKIWDCDPRKVSVVHLGFDSFQDIPRVKKENYQERQFGDYILFVGSRSGHKNFLNFLNAFGCADELNSDFNLICFGGGPFNDVEIALISKLELHDHVCQVEGDDSTLGDLYRGASLFVYPSVYEGFGIPPLEAMSVGCPVACANSSSIPEVCGKAVDYFDPLDINSIASSLTRVLGDSKYSELLASAGIAQAKKFSWHKCAVETLKCYQVTSDSQRAS